MPMIRRNPDFVYPPVGQETVPADFERGFIQVFDDDPVAIGEQCGDLGPTHLARIREPEYAYQLGLLFEELAEDHPRSVRAVAPDGRVWVKRGARFVREVVAATTVRKRVRMVKNGAASVGGPRVSARAETTPQQERLGER